MSTGSKPLMPKPAPFVQVKGVTVDLDADMDRYSSGSGRIAVGGSKIYAGPEDDAALIGEVRAIPDGGVAVIVKDVRAEGGSRMWYISPTALWDLAREADVQWESGEAEKWPGRLDPEAP